MVGWQCRIELRSYYSSTEKAATSPGVHDRRNRGKTIDKVSIGASQGSA